MRLEDFEKNVMELSLHFLSRKYPEDLILEAALSTRQLNRLDLLNKKRETKDGKNNVFLIITFHPNDHQVIEIAYDNWDILGQIPTTEKLYTKKL